MLELLKDKLALRMSVNDFNDVISANLTSTFIGCKAALKFMGKKRFGSIVNISSIIGEMGNAGQTNYAASKGGVNAMTKVICKRSIGAKLKIQRCYSWFYHF